MTFQERITLLLKAKKLLNKQAKGEELTSIDVTLAHDYVDMVIDDMVSEEFKKRRYNGENI